VRSFIKKLAADSGAAKRHGIAAQRQAKAPGAQVLRARRFLRPAVFLSPSFRL